jgi:hypothetical protein
VNGRPAPQAFFLGFDDSALRFELRAWTHRLDDLLGVKSDLGVSVYAALREAGMAIALNALAVAWIAIITVVFALPPNELVLWTMLALALALAVYWRVSARARFPGPRAAATRAR